LAHLNSIQPQCVIELLDDLWGLDCGGYLQQLICFGFDGVIMFIGVQNGVTTQICKRIVPFVFVVHCVAH
jgi:hypothetical protein